MAKKKLSYNKIVDGADFVSTSACFLSGVSEGVLQSLDTLRIFSNESMVSYIPVFATTVIGAVKGKLEELAFNREWRALQKKHMLQAKQEILNGKNPYSQRDRTDVRRRFFELQGRNYLDYQGVNVKNDYRRFLQKIKEETKSEIRFPVTGGALGFVKGTGLYLSGYVIGSALGSIYKKHSY